MQKTVSRPIRTLRTAFSNKRWKGPTVVKATAKEVVEAISLIPGMIQVRSQQDGATLEANSRLGSPTYSFSPQGQSQIATFRCVLRDEVQQSDVPTSPLLNFSIISNADSEIVVQLDLAKITDAKIEKTRSKDGTYDMYGIHLLGIDQRPDIRFFLHGKSPDKASIQAWQQVQDRFGQEVVLDDSDSAGEAMFSFSEA